jgi:hypothetical protein
MSFESELRDSLRRKEPPPDFTANVMKAIGAPASRRPVRRRLAGALGLAAALALILSTFTIHYVEQRREGERAKEQLMLAMRLTSKKLHETQQHLQR